MNLMVDNKRLNDLIDEARYRAASDRQARLTRRAQALLAAAGMDVPHRHWFVLTVAPGADKAVDGALADAGFERWMPAARIVPPRRGGRGGGARPIYDKPAFPGYVFVRVADVPDAWSALMTVKGVMGVLGGACRPTSVADAVVAELRAYLASDPEAVAILTNAVKIGDAVTVKWGPLASLPGVVEKIDGKGRALIDMLIFGRSCTVELDLARIAKL